MEDISVAVGAERWLRRVLSSNMQHLLHVEVSYILEFRVSAEVGTNFTDKPRSLGRDSSSLAD
jgi:hypothetical protein